MTYPCSGCGLRSCQGDCFLECEADYAEEPRFVWVKLENGKNRLVDTLYEPLPDVQLTECHGDPLLGRAA